MFPHVLYGGDYNPEQWSPEVWREDARLMQEAGVNRVSLGIFSWARLETAPGRFDFSWLDQVMDLLHGHGVHVNLATPTASPPPWLIKLHPEILPVNVDGVRLWHGSRRHYCPHSRDYREAALRIVTALAEHTASKPGLALWHVDNEYACQNSECFCDESVAAFRAWLQERYGDLDAFNEAWGTDFWGQRYGDWDEVMAPRRSPAPVNPAQRLDWLRFCSDSWLACFEDQKAVLRRITPEVPITTNFMGFFKPVDYWKFAASEDLVSNDAYPDHFDPEWMVQSGMMCDLMRSLRGGAPWLLMEQAPSHVNWRVRNSTKRPGMMRLGSYQALARGANGIMFFQWRASRAGSEKFHSGMVPHVGTDSRVWREVSTLGAELRGLDVLLPARVQAQAAIVLDWSNWWALESGDKPLNDFKLLPQIGLLYGELFRRNVTVDFVPPDGDLARYSLVIAPHLYLVDERGAENLTRYVENGGTLLMTFMSGLVDGNDRVYLGGYPAPFRKALGMWVEEFAACPEGRNNEVETEDGKRFSCDEWNDVIRLEGASALASFRGDYFAGGPAVTQHAFGKGTGFYAGTRLSAEGRAWLFDRVCAQANISPVMNAPRGVEVTRRSDGTHSWLFMLNYSDEPAETELPGPGVELLTGRAVAATMNLEPQAVAIVQLAQS